MSPKPSWTMRTGSSRRDFIRRTLFGGAIAVFISRAASPPGDMLGVSIADQLGSRDTNAKYFRDLREVSIDYKKFKLFELSILWRAGLESKSWGKEVSLGPFQEELREHLLNEDPGPALYLPAMIVDARLRSGRPTI